MSFGFSIGDFITVIELANKIRTEFISAPSQLKDISNEVRSLSIVLQDAGVVSSGYELNEQQKTNLQEIAGSCHKVLLDLENILDKYDELQAHGGNFGKRVKRVWKRLEFEPDDIRQLRDRLTSNITLLSTSITQISSQATIAARKGIDLLNQRQHDSDRRAILDWLSPLDYAAQQSDFVNRRQAGTGQWLLDSPEFQTWLQADKRTLFCPGIPGAGKTILTSIVVDKLTSCFRGNKTIGIAYVYCNFRRTHEQQAEDLIASLLKQLSQGQPTLPVSVKSLYDKHRDQRTRPSLDEISNALRSVTTVYSKAFIIIDALDECQTADGCRERFLTELFNLMAQSGANLFATSRLIPEITERFHGITLEIRASSEDVRRYVDGHISHLPSFVGRNPGLKEQVATDIIKAVDGMFLLAKLHLDSLIGKRSPKAVRTALAKLPSGSDAYDHAYQNAMERIKGQVADQEELAKQVLSWITCAERPLTTEEICHALAVEVGEPKLDEENLPQLEDIVSVCAGLVTVDEQSGIIRLVHYTTQDYFKRTREQWFPDAQAKITEICVAYISFAVFRSGYCESDDEFEQRLQLHSLYHYASCSWGYHARQASTLGREVIDFLQCRAKVGASSQALMAVKLWARHSDYSQAFPRQMTGLHLAAFFGVGQGIKGLLQAGVEVDTKNNYGRTPLSYAAEGGHEAVVKLLLDTGKVDADTKDNFGRTPLSYAAGGGYEAVVKLLLDTGKVDIDTKNNSARTPLSYAAGRGHEAVVKLHEDILTPLIDYKLDHQVSSPQYKSNEENIKPDCA